MALCRSGIVICATGREAVPNSREVSRRATYPTRSDQGQLCESLRVEVPSLPPCTDDNYVLNQVEDRN